MDKYTDPEFDIEGDLNVKNCLEGLEYWLKDAVEQGGNVSPGSLGDALATLAQSNILPQSGMVIDLNNTAKILDFNAGGSYSPRPGSVHRIVRHLPCTAVLGSLTDSTAGLDL